MEPVVEIKYDEKILEVLGEYELASIEVGEWVYVWIGDEENRDMAHKIADGDMPIEEAMKALEYKYPLEPKIWLRAIDEEADATIYILMPKFFGVFAEHLQLYLSSICKCGCPIGVGVICNAPEPWNCMHSTVIVCAKCGEEIAKISAVHGGGWGKVVSLRDFEALREMVVTEGDEE